MDEKTKHCWESNKSKENYEIMAYIIEYKRNLSIWNVVQSLKLKNHSNVFVAEIKT